jgi:hypothetical protein
METATQRPPRALYFNKKTKGKGDLSALEIANRQNEQRYQHLTRPNEAHKKGSFKNLTAEATSKFFNPATYSKKAAAKSTTTTLMSTPTTNKANVSPQFLCEAITKMVTDSAFCKKHKLKSTPLAMLAFAEVVAEKVVRPNLGGYFHHTLALEVPPASNMVNNPQYHSIVGQKLLLVDWDRTFGMTVPCPDASCSGILQNDRTNFSKNKTLFPIFGLDGAPAWCIVQSMTCPSCRR